VQIARARNSSHAFLVFVSPGLMARACAHPTKRGTHRNHPPNVPTTVYVPQVPHSHPTGLKTGRRGCTVRWRAPGLHQQRDACEPGNRAHFPGLASSRRARQRRVPNRAAGPPPHTPARPHMATPTRPRSFCSHARGHSRRGGYRQCNQDSGAGGGERRLFRCFQGHNERFLSVFSFLFRFPPTDERKMMLYGEPSVARLTFGGCGH
jgi:hypothetical protein